MTILSVVFPVYNNFATVRVTLPAILNQQLAPGFEAEVIVVDDGSAPQVKDWLASVDGIHLVSFAENRGRSAARNAGVKASRGEIVVFLDSDVIVCPDFLAAHGAALAGGADISLGRLVDTETLDGPEGRSVPPMLPGPAHFSTANVAIRREFLERVAETADGPFDAATFTAYGWEDLELERRLARLTPARSRAPGAFGFHVCPPFSPDRLPGMINKEVQRAAMARRFVAKHPDFAVRMITQMTPLHRALWEILSLGGLLNARSLDPLLRWLASRGKRRLAESIARHTILNPTYVRHL